VGIPDFFRLLQGTGVSFSPHEVVRSFFPPLTTVTAFSGHAGEDAPPSPLPFLAHLAAWPSSDRCPLWGKVSHSRRGGTLSLLS